MAVSFANTIYTPSTGGLFISHTATDVTETKHGNPAPHLLSFISLKTIYFFISFYISFPVLSFRAAG